VGLAKGVNSFTKFLPVPVKSMGSDLGTSTASLKVIVIYRIRSYTMMMKETMCKLYLWTVSQIAAIKIVRMFVPMVPIDP
jgi:hypothetical protein